MLKFRTMREDCVDTGPRITACDDPRVTRVGRILRHTKLNELPQLVNVLRGEMSLVGPRPEDPRYVAYYSPEQRRVLSATPGITSIASIVYHDEESMLSQGTLDDTYVRVIMPHKLELDLEYLDHRSFLVDLDILWRTAQVLSPRFAQASPEIEELLCGPVQRLIRRHLSWFTIDLVLGVVAVSLACFVWRRAGAPLNASWLHRIAYVTSVAFVFALVNQFCGLQHDLWAYASSHEAFSILLATALSTLLFVIGGLVFAVSFERIVLGGFFAFALFVAARYRKRLLRGGLRKLRGLRTKQREAGCRRVLVVGTGGISRFVATQLQRRRSAQYQLVGFVDDDLTRRGMCICGLTVLGSCRAIPSLVAKHSVNLLIVPADEADAHRRQAILEICRSTPAQIKVIPDLLRFIDDSSEILPDKPLAYDPAHLRETAPSLTPKA
jgi:hypothetical protein